MADSTIRLDKCYNIFNGLNLPQMASHSDVVFGIIITMTYAILNQFMVQVWIRILQSKRRQKIVVYYKPFESELSWFCWNWKLV